MKKGVVTKVYVCMHKPSACLNDDVYKPIHVGRLEVDFDLGFETDCEGDHIGEKHFAYSEYTGIYWIWKNLKNVDYIGWNHYRRYFALNYTGSFKPETINIGEDQMSNWDFSAEKLNEIFDEYDIILPVKKIFNKSVWNFMSHIHDKRDMDLMEKTMKEMHPEYGPTLDRILKNSNQVEMMSIFITKWDIFNDYCKWLFPILLKLESLTDPATNAMHTERKIAFMAELLTPVYFHFNRLRIKNIPVVWINSEVPNKPPWRYHASAMKSKLKFLLGI